MPQNPLIDLFKKKPVYNPFLPTKEKVVVKPAQYGVNVEDLDPTKKITIQDSYLERGEN